jgi:hypothetical protein
MGQHSVLVNETVGQSDKAGYSDLILQLSGAEQNLTYSRLVNASDDLFPYFPNLAAQSFDYSNGTSYSVHANFSETGTVMVSFKGNQYTLNVYSISVAASYGTKKLMANATIEAFPSTLVYSLSAGNSTFGARAVLQATDLPLLTSSTQTSTAAYVGAGVGVGVLAMGGVFFVRRRGKRVETRSEKPLHWVD